MIDGFILLEKISDLQRWLYPIVDKWPRAEKFSTCTEVRQCVDRMIRHAVTSRKSRDGYRHLHEIDVELHVLREKLRYAYARRYITKHRLLHATKLLREIGRIIGGLLRKYEKQ